MRQKTGSNRVPDMVNVFCRQTFEVRQPLKQTVAPKVKLFTCFWWARSTHLLFFAILSSISRTETAHLLLRIILWSFTTPEILLNVLRWIFCWSKSNQVNKQLSTLLVNIRLTPTQNSAVWWQLERVFSSCVHAQMQPTVNGLPTSYKVFRQVILDMICYNKRPFSKF